MTAAQSKTGLKQNGYSGLVRQIGKHREMFAHIPQDKPSNQGDVSSMTTEQSERGIAKRRSEFKRGLGGQDLCIQERKHPELFSHIPQDRPVQRPEEWVPIAEKLAAENGGQLRSIKWLRSNGYRGLSAAMSKHVALFAHIPQAGPIGPTPRGTVARN